MSVNGNGRLRFGDYEFDSQSEQLLRRGRPVKLQPQPLRVLQALLEHPFEIVSRECLRERIWGNSTFVEFDQGLNYCIRQIRVALRDAASQPVYIETLPKQGYRFIAPVTAAPNAVEPSIPSAPEPSRPSGLIDAVGHQPRGTNQRGVIVICVVAVALLAGGFLLYHGRAQTAAPPVIRSLAVLPLKNLSEDPNQEYISDGMTEELIGRLAGIHGLRVISRTSSMRLKGTKLLAPDIAKMLHVDALVEGSVMLEGGRIRVHAQLIRGTTDEHFWSETYDREMGDVLALESEVAQAIAERVQVTLTGQEHSRLVTARHVSPEVYESYLRGQFGARNTRAELEENVTHFEEAIRKDPTFAPAYVGLANTYVELSTIFVGASPDEMRPKVLRAAQKALALDPELAEAHALLADVYRKRWHWTEAETEYKRALQLKPSDAAALLGYATWLLCEGHIEEALAWAQRARELDPLGTTDVDIAWILFLSRRYDETIRELQSVLAVHPDSAFANWFMGFALIAKGHPEEALPELEKIASLMHRSPGSLELLATAYGYAGRRTEALRVINELKQRREKSYVPAGAFINPYLALRDYNEAFSWFDRAYAEQSNILQFLKVHPFFDPIRGDPRFQDLLRRVGLK